jgi:hypothetical protein
VPEPVVEEFVEQIRRVASDGGDVEAATRVATELGVLDLDLLGRAFAHIRQISPGDADEAGKRLIAGVLSAVAMHESERGV